jgi:hypothetical protein
VRSAICDDSATLRGHGYQVLDFAYPYGRGFRRSAVLEALQECGYVSARTYGLLRESWDCVSIRCPYAEAIPPPEPYRIRTPGYKSAPLSVEDLKLSVQQALDNGGGWVPLVFHEIDSSGDPASVTPGDFKAFLDWLQGSGAVVRTVRSVMGYPDLPATPEPPLPVHAFGPAALDTVAALASVNVRKKQDVDKIQVTAAMLEPGTLRARGTVRVPGAARVFRLKGGSASAAPGKRVKLRLKLKKKALRIAKRAIHKHRRVRASITITATDRAGNEKTAKRAVRLTD